MKRGWGLGFFLCMILWIVAPAAQAPAESPRSDAAGGDGEVPSLRLASARMAAFFSEYEARREEVQAGTVLAARTESEVAGELEEAEGAEPPTTSISDPIESVNRAFYRFNDKLYFWVLKPAAQGYRTVVPETARVGVRNFFYNLAGPVRMINCALQGKGEEAGYEFVRLFMNTTVGLGGFLDVAGGEAMQLERYEEDLGQTLGVYGMGPSFYIHWPFLGPSSGRDTLGTIGDSFLNPVNYLVPEAGYNAAVRVYDRVNETSLTIGDYEDLKRSALDPYVALRDAYYQHRENRIRE
ncbi:MAG: VacJ family lipoprotein [Deltaproteobacteria bacterium]|nr:VacJ family lipoprotein [Deltaproteobacteria bacterium]